jgi:hypothetical protein
MTTAGEVARRTGGLIEEPRGTSSAARLPAPATTSDLGDMISTFLMVRMKLSWDASSL